MPIDNIPLPRTPTLWHFALLAGFEAAVILRYASGLPFSHTDSTGSLPVVDGASVGTLLACSAGRPVVVTAEWTVAGLVPLTVHVDDRAVDIGPVADPSFVGIAS